MDRLPLHKQTTMQYLSGGNMNKMLKKDLRGRKKLTKGEKDLLIMINMMTWTYTKSITGIILKI